MSTQFLASPAVARASRRKPWFVIPALMGRWTFVAAGLTILFVGEDQPGLVIGMVILAVLTYALLDGVVASAWVELMGGSLTNRSRAYFLGYIQAFEGPLALLVTVMIVHHILEMLPFPENYGWLFVIGGVMNFLSVMVFNVLRERPTPPDPSAPTLRHYVGHLHELTKKDDVFRHYLIVRFLFFITRAVTAFYIVYGTKILLQPSAELVSLFLILGIVGRMTGALIGGYISERYGSRLGIWLGLLAAIVHTLAAVLSAQFGVVALYVSAFFLGFETVMFKVGFLNWVVEYAPEGQRPVYGAMASLIGIVSIVMPVVAGTFISLVSYEMLFLLALLVACTASVLALRLIEPREHKLKFQEERIPL
jgi:Na+/melibiose symporter-like transporter